ncbi:protein-tyrosine-phosphatase [Algoriphagus lacus]|uniref:Protein-tyrosine-phosphatase n=2 Tax=Algoriphagus lacus TaxID=2056311 RepID=A0A418PM86_9BACT|nr:protein-tyrosine-phosphatase [Algoriphagus lacus]
MTQRPNILIICGKNKRRSRTGEFIFKNDSRFNVRSAGLSPKSDRKISEGDLNWSDLVYVMETEHRTKIRDLYGHLDLPAIEVLHVPDEYEFMDEELVDLLTERINQSLQSAFGI